MVMKIAVTYENGEVFQHFGHTEQFKLYGYPAASCCIHRWWIQTAVVTIALAVHFEAPARCECLQVCSGIGGGAQAALAEANIRLIGGVQGNADEAVQAFLNGTLAFDPNVHCTHHDHGEGHSCGSHGCGGHCHE